MHLQALIWFLLAFLVVTPAEADPITGLIIAFAKTALGGYIINAAIGIALSVGASLLQGLFAKKSESRDPGTTVQLRVGGGNPLMFPLGQAPTAGVRVYSGTWSGGGTPNAYIVDVVALSALPLPGAPVVLWMNDKKVTVRTDLPKTEMGWPIEEYYKTKKKRYHAWVDFFDGTQTTPNPYLLSKFGGNPDYPWQSDMIGRGIAYATITCLWDKHGLWTSGYPDALFELPSIPLYDIRKDSTEGGVGTHRWGQFNTYEPSNNSMVRAYNVIRGIYYNDEWVFGGQNWPAHRLPVSSWMAAMNACDATVGGEPQYHGGGVVECDFEVATVIEELMRSSSALIAEVGGAYKVRVGAPGAPVMAFTDNNIVVTREQGYEPFPGLESTYNIARITYTEPAERWNSKESPERRDEVAINSDDNRELPFSIDLPWVLSNLTAQRVAKAALENGRRFKRHSAYYPPLFWLIEPLDVVAWTSGHNQYVNKSFDVEQVTGSSSLMQAMIIRENDPSDFSWNPATDPLPYQVVPVVPNPVGVQIMSGWQVFPAAILDEEGRARRPSIEVHFTGDLTDIDRVLVQVKPEGFEDAQLIFDGSVPYPIETVPVARIILNGDFPPNSRFEVRGQFVPFTDRDAEWSSWLPVTTPDIKLVPGLDFDPYEGVTGFDNLDDDLAGYQQWVGAGVREIERRLEELELHLADQDFGNAYDRQMIREGISATYEQSTAEWSNAVDVVATANTALSQRVESLDAEVFDPLTGLPSVASAVDVLSAYAGPDGTLAEAVTSLSAAVTPGEVNEANFRMQVVSGPTGYSRIGAQTRQGGSGSWRGAAWYLDTPNDPVLPTRMVVQADQFIVAAGPDLNNPFIVDGDAIRMNVANIGTVTAGFIKSPDGKFEINLLTGELEWWD